jgi:glycosyltransferase involved in cell wall biosynthesis
MPLVSLLIANLNNGRFLSEALASAIAQTHREMEIVVVDDGSSDNSVEVIQSFTASHPEANILFYRNEQPAGCGRIKRQLIELSHGEFFIFLDPEDTMTPEAIATLLAEHERGTYSIVYGTHYLCDEQLQPIGVSNYPGAIPAGQSHLTSKEGHISAPALCRRSCYDRTEGINPKYYVSEDQDLYLKMEEVASVLFVNKPLYYYRHHGNNTSWNDDKTFTNYYWRYHCMRAAYLRRKRNKLAVDNLSKHEMNRMTRNYCVRLAKYPRKAIYAFFSRHTNI